MARLLMMFGEFWHHGALGALSHDVYKEFWASTVRSLMMLEEFWASRCSLSGCLKSFGRHGALSLDV